MSKDTLKKILERTVTIPALGCMEWTGCLNTDGYARMSFKGNSNIKVHRLVYQLTRNINIDGKIVRHSCDNPTCVNPEHLVIGTVQQNVGDRVERGRSRGHVVDEDTFKIKTLRNYGASYKDIASHLNIKPKRVEYILNKIKAEALGG